MDPQACYVFTRDGRLLSRAIASENEDILPVSTNLDELVQSFLQESEFQQKWSEVVYNGFSALVLRYLDFMILLIADVDEGLLEITDVLIEDILPKYIPTDTQSNELNSIAQELTAIIYEQFSTEKIDPIHQLTSIRVFDLPPELQETAIVLMDLQKVTIEQLEQELDDSTIDITDILEKLIEKGYVGVEKKLKKQVYFVL